MQNATKVSLTKKGATHSARAGGNYNNAASWQAVTATLAKGNATVGTLVKAIATANPTNVGNAMPYLKYQLRNGNIAVVK